MNKKSKLLAFILWLIGGFGAFGFHRFYVGKIGTGIIWLLTGGVFMVGAIIDVFLIGSMVDTYNLKQDVKSLKY